MQLKVRCGRPAPRAVSRRARSSSKRAAAASHARSAQHAVVRTRIAAGSTAGLHQSAGSLVQSGRAPARGGRKQRDVVVEEEPRGLRLFTSKLAPSGFRHVRAVPEGAGLAEWVNIADHPGAKIVYIAQFYAAGK